MQKGDLFSSKFFHKHMDVLLSHPLPGRAQYPKKALLKLDTVGFENTVKSLFSIWSQTLKALLSQGWQTRFGSHLVGGERVASGTWAWTVGRRELGGGAEGVQLAGGPGAVGGTGDTAGRAWNSTGVPVAL